MKLIGVRGVLALVIPIGTMVAWNVQSASGGAGSTQALSTAQAAPILSASPPDPVAFCRSLTGFNVIIGTSNNDVLTGTPGNDCIVGLGAQDVINGLGGDDIIFGGDGDDQIDGGPGNDQIFAGSGQDVVRGGDGNDRIFGEDGDDQLFGGAGNDLMNGGQGQDRLFGEGGNDDLIGGTGDDQLSGGDGDDTLEDCENHNRFDGGSGTNTCRGTSDSSSPNSSTFISCATTTPCAPNTQAVLGEATALLTSQGMQDLINIVNASDGSVSPLVRAARDVLVRVRQNSDLLTTPPANLTPTQRARLQTLRNDIQSSPLFTTVAAAGQQLLADPAALNADIDQWAARAAMSPSPMPPPPSATCGGGQPALRTALNAFTAAPAIRGAVVTSASTALNNRSAFVTGITGAGALASFTAGLLVPPSVLINRPLAGGGAAASGIFSLGRFLSGVGEAVLGGAGVALGVVGIVAGVATGQPELVAGGVAVIVLVSPLLIQATNDIADSFTGEPACPFATIQCLVGCPADTTCVSQCCFPSSASGQMQSALISSNVVVCATDSSCGSPSTCDENGCCVASCGPGGNSCHTASDCPSCSPGLRRCSIAPGASSGCCSCIPA